MLDDRMTFTPSTARRLASLKAFSRLASGFALLVGTLVLVGWALGLSLLTSVLTGLSTMKANTAAGFMLAGASLWLLRGERADRSSTAAHRAGQALALVVALIGLLTISEYLFEWDLGIDELLFRVDPGTGVSGASGRMGLNTAAGFLLVGAGLLLLDVETRRGVRPAEWLALGAAAIAVPVLVGYAYSVQSFRMVSYSQMALHTALTFAVLSAGLLCARPDRGLMAIATGEGPGGVLVRRLLPAIALVPFVVGWLRLEGQRAGLYGTEIGLILFATFNVAVIAAVLYRQAWLLDRADVDRRRAEALVETRAREQALVAELGQRALAGRDPSDLMNDIVRETAAVLDVPLCKILELRPDGESFLLRAGVGWKEGYVGHAAVAAGADSQAGYTLASDAPVIVADLRAERRFSGPALLCEHGVVSGISVIIRGHERAFGVLGAHTQRRRVFSSDDVSFLLAVANVVAAAIENARTRAALQASEARFRRLLEWAPDAIVTVGGDGRIVFVNERTGRLFGYDAAELLGQPVEMLVPERVRPAHEGQCRAYQHEPQPRPMGVGLELSARRKDGSEFPVEISLSPVQSDDGVLVSCAVRDVTARHQAEEAMRRSEARYRALFMDALTANYVSTPDGRLVGCNPAFAQLFGFASVEEAMASDPASFFARPEARQEFLDLLRAQKRLEYRESTLRRRDGRPVHVIENVVGTFDEQGDLVEIKGYLIDVTQRKQLEEQLRLSQKLEAVGRLAGGIAHDFNNLLTVMLGHAELLLDELPAGSQSHANVEEIRGAAVRAADLTRQLLAFSRRQLLQPTVLNLNEVVRGIDSLMRRLIGEDVDLRTELGARLGHVKADRGQLEQVIVNLVVNARDAMPRGGRLTIETGNVELDEEYVSLHGSVIPGRYALLAISDTGVGMDAETIRQIFEPFFTTKGPEKGTGLGLATVYGIVKQSGGNIWVYSEPGQGATFKVYLPLVDEPLEPRTAPARAVEKLGGSETILLVEDEASVRDLATRVLTHRGYRVLGARDGEEALRLVEQHAGPIDLVLTDVVLPQMSGRELIGRLAPRVPNAAVLFMSGYTHNAIQHHGVLERGIEFLQKPFGPNDLARRVREVLDARKMP